MFLAFFLLTTLLQRDTNEHVEWDAPSRVVKATEIVLQPAPRLSVTYPDGTHSFVPIPNRGTLKEALQSGYRNRGLTFAKNPPYVVSEITGEKVQAHLESLAADWNDQHLIIATRPLPPKVVSLGRKTRAGGRLVTR